MSPMALPDPPLPLLSHLAELRRRLLISAAVIILFGIAAYAWRETLVAAALLPARLQGLVIYYTAPQEAFVGTLMLSFVAGLVAGSPVVLYHALAFSHAALTARERRAGWALLPIASVLFIAGALFSYLIAVPVTLAFLTSQTGAVTPLLTFSSLLSFEASLVLGMGLVFLAPVVVAVLVRTGIADVRTLARGRPYVLVAALALAAVLTPPDIFSQLVLAVPFLLLFEAGLLAARISDLGTKGPARKGMRKIGVG
ncbi:twin-arginine translocase subunit TatC [Candidatus Woesearchaeota archaeon]|nr:twin-arginine translocase subunit TatC [Candidatus Woesearchaeota archaeon]